MLKQRLKNGEKVFGMFMIEFSAPCVCEVMAYAGFDFVIIDTEHSSFNFETAANSIRASKAAGISPLVRVWENNPALIGKFMDAGPEGVMVPQVETPAQAEDAVKAARYAPLGMRGVCPMSRYTLLKDRYETLNRDTLLCIQIEGLKGINNIADIFKVKGFDVVFVGPYDLSQSLGIPGQIKDPKVSSMVKDILLKKPKEIQLGIYVQDMEMARLYRDLGVQFIAYSIDSLVFLDACRKIVNDLKTT